MADNKDITGSRDVLVIGGGAAGMMTAIIAARRGLKVALAEKNDKLGKKLYITGKGRCNITNDCDTETLINSLVVNNKFMYGAFKEFSSSDTIAFFEGLGVKTKTERGNRVFPVSDKSSDVIRALEKEMRRLGVDIRLSSEVKDICTEPGDGEMVCTGAVLSSGEKIPAGRTVVATGGISYRSTGSTGDGYRFAEAAGHSVSPLYPALAPLNIKESFAADMQGLSLKNAGLTVRNADSRKVLYSGFGELLFTHFGVSGPLVLSAESFIVEKTGKTGIELSIDFKPALDEKKLDIRLIRELEESPGKSYANVLKTLLPAKAIPVFISRLGADPAMRACEVDSAMRGKLRRLLKDFGLTVTGTRGFNEAIITRGGVCVKEINPKTFESKKVKGLFFTGEVLDLDAVTGGFNLQIAWSSAYRCASGMDID